MRQVALYAALLWITAAFAAGSMLGAFAVWWDKRHDYDTGWDEAERAVLGDPDPRLDDDFEDLDLYDSRDWMDAPEDDAVTVAWLGELAGRRDRVADVLDRAKAVLR